MWESVVGNILIAAGVFMTYIVYKELKTTVEMSKEFNALNKEVIEAAEILHDLLKEEKR